MGLRDRPRRNPILPTSGTRTGEREMGLFTKRDVLIGTALASIWAARKLSKEGVVARSPDPAEKIARLILGFVGLVIASPFVGILYLIKKLTGLEDGVFALIALVIILASGIVALHLLRYFARRLEDARLDREEAELKKCHAELKRRQIEDARRAYCAEVVRKRAELKKCREEIAWKIAEIARKPTGTS